MMEFAALSQAELNGLYQRLNKRYQSYQAAKSNLDLTRGKPATEQLNLSSDLDGILSGFYLLQDGTDVRNYGGFLGIPEARALGGQLLALAANQVMVGGNSSLSLMYAYIAFMLKTAWQSQADSNHAAIKFLCPVPGYDRHFTICEHFGIEMINVTLNHTGPDMDQIESLLQTDPMIKGIWCVPKYANPTGITYTDATVKRFTTLPYPADFRIMWDNAYVVHDLTETPDSLSNLMAEARSTDKQDHIAVFGSTSKITFAGAGISFIGLSENNLQAFEEYLSAATIGADKVNQLRHTRFLKDKGGVLKHMQKHAAIIKPKFAIVQEKLTQHLAGKGIATWTQPNGGYFISLNTLPGLATQVIALAAAVGVKLTPAGATFPYGQDPDNSNIRIAPTYPNIANLEQALDILVVCIQLASTRKILAAHDSVTP